MKRALLYPQASFDERQSFTQAATATFSAYQIRTELLMALDLFVRAERALHDEEGAYPRALGRVPDVLGALTRYYRIEVARATRNHLIVTASGEMDARDAPLILGQIAEDRVSIDENFRVRANFPLSPAPRDYLHLLAQQVMNRIFANHFQVPERDELDLWEGVFQGYFRYEERQVSQGGRTLVAVGLASPVKGDLVEMQPGANLYEWVFEHRNAMWAQGEALASLEKLYLAQRIYYRHVGSYAPSLQAVMPIWHGLAVLASDQSPITLQDLQLDPTFGYQAEVAQRPSLLMNEAQGMPRGSSRGPSSLGYRVWSINSYNQVSEIMPIEGLMRQFEQTRWKLEGHGLEPLPERKPFKMQLGRKPLLIDVVEGDQ